MDRFGYVLKVEPTGLDGETGRKRKVARIMTPRKNWDICCCGYNREPCPEAMWIMSHHGRGNYFNRYLQQFWLINNFIIYLTIKHSLPNLPSYFLGVKQISNNIYYKIFFKFKL